MRECLYVSMCKHEVTNDGKEVSKHEHTYVYMYVCVNVCMYACVNVCMYACVSMRS
jgi:hypothetical protein